MYVVATEYISVFVGELGTDWLMLIPGFYFYLYPLADSGPPHHPPPPSELRTEADVMMRPRDNGRGEKGWLESLAGPGRVSACPQSTSLDGHQAPG